MSATGDIERRIRIRMHSRWLNLMPRVWEQQYFAQLEGLDLLNCLITPLFFASALARWPRSLLGTVYCLVLGIKGYQMALLLLPAARQNNAHAKARYWIILAERLLRQFVATPVLGRGVRFVQWMQEAAAADPGPLMAFRLAMLVSGVTHAFWNAFCLPLDITSQVVINGLFFLLHVGPTCAQVGYAVGMLVKHKPRLVWLQCGIEQLCSTLFSTLQLLLTTLAAAARGSSSSSSSSSDTPLLQQQQQQQQQQQGQQADAFTLVAMPPGLGPDVETHAGRLVLATSLGLMLLVVLYLPLLFAWRLERHLKARFMATVLQRASESNSSSPLPSPAGKGSSKGFFGFSGPLEPSNSTPSSSTGADCASSRAAAAADGSTKGGSSSSSSHMAQGSKAAGGTTGDMTGGTAGGTAGGTSGGCAAAAGGTTFGTAGGTTSGCTAAAGGTTGICTESAGATAGGCTANGIAGSLWAADYIKPPAAFPLFPTEKGALRRHLLLAAGTCFVLGEVFVWLCTLSPWVGSLIWPQVVHNPSFVVPEQD